MKHIYACLLSVAWLAVPHLASAAWIDRHAVDREWFEGNVLIHKVVDDLGAFPRSGLSTPGAPIGSGLPDALINRDGRSENDRQDSNFSGPDMAPSIDVPDSVQGYTGGVDRPFFGRRPEGDPTVRDLSGMDAGVYGPSGPSGSPSGSLGR